MGNKKTISYRFDAVGNRIGMTDPDGGRFTYSYDAVDRIKEVVNPQGDRTTYGYDPGGRRTVKKLANGTRASFTYDTASNVTTLANLKSDNTVISSFEYQYDKMGNRTSVVEADGSRVTWTYDDTYQLTGEHRTGSNAYEDSYSYDPAGNRLLKIHDGARTTYSYDAANQLEYSEDASGRTTYTFDADGNQERVLAPNGDRTTTSWDYENRTTLVQQPSGIRNTMAYEPGGLRMKLEESTGTKKFVWDGQNYLAETDENDDTQVVYTNEPQVYGNLVSQRRGADSHWYQFDAIGSTRELTDSSEMVTDTRLCDAWGHLLSASGTTVFPFQFVGQLGYHSHGTLPATYVRARHYASNAGAWTSRDPLYPAVWGVHPFAYVRNAPVTFVDPSGLLRISCHCFRGGSATGRDLDRWVTTDCVGLFQRCCREACSALGYPGTWHWNHEWERVENPRYRCPHLPPDSTFPHSEEICELIEEITQLYLDCYEDKVLTDEIPYECVRLAECVQSKLGTISTDPFIVYGGGVANWWGILPIVGHGFPGGISYDSPTDAGIFIYDPQTGNRLYVHGTPIGIGPRCCQLQWPPEVYVEDYDPNYYLWTWWGLVDQNDNLPPRIWLE